MGRVSCAAGLSAELLRLLPDWPSLLTATWLRGSSWLETDANGLRGPAGSECRVWTGFLLDLALDALGVCPGKSSQGEAGAECLLALASDCCPAFTALLEGTAGLGASYLAA